MDALPPPSLPPPPAYAVAPSEIYPVSKREAELCAKASHPDYFYLAGMAALDVAGIWIGSLGAVKYSDSEAVREFAGPGLIGLTWGVTVGGVWLALPKCEPHWVGETPREGTVRESWPLALSLALLAGATAPIINAIAIGYTLPTNWSTPEREVHIIFAGVAGFGGAFLPYLFPPATVRAAAELDKLRFGFDGRSGYVGYAATF